MINLLIEKQLFKISPRRFDIAVAWMQVYDPRPL